MKTYTFRKIYQRLTEKDEGYMINAIVIFQKKQWLMNSRTLDDKEAKEKGYRYENVCIKYKYFLRIDLWFVYFTWVWEGKDLTK